jgi:hypothetical protein
VGANGPHTDADLEMREIWEAEDDLRGAISRMSWRKASVATCAIFCWVRIKPSRPSWLRYGHTTVGWVPFKPSGESLKQHPIYGQLAIPA